MPAEEDSAPVDGRNAGSPQQFVLRWNNYQSNLTSCFDQLLQSQSFVDVTLACDGKSLKAHKVVLSACSPYFQSLLMDNPCQHPIIIIKDIRYSDLKAAVDFMYRGEINVAQNQIPALLKVADTLRIRGLTDVDGEHASLAGYDAACAGPSSLAGNGAPAAGSSGSYGGAAASRATRRAHSPGADSHGEARRRRHSDDDEHGPSGSGGRVHASPGSSPPQDLLPPPEPHAAAPTPGAQPLHDDIDIRPGIAEMIREEERARMLETTQAWMGAASTSTALAAETYQYRMQSLWQQCWSTNQNMVHNLRLRERGPLKSWRPETMAEAIFSVLKEGLSLSQAARKYDIPYPTFVLYANRVHNMLGPSADGGADLRPKGRGRPQRILLGVWPDDHIRGVIRAVVFRETQGPHNAHAHMREIEMPTYPAVTDGAGGPSTVPVGGNGCGNGREGRVSPNAAAAAAVAAVAHGLRRQMCNMVVAAQRPPDHPPHLGLPPLPLHSPRMPSPLTAGLESPLCSPPPPGHALEPARPSEPFRPFASPRPDSRYGERDSAEMGPPKTPVSRNGQGASPASVDTDPSATDARMDI